MREVANQTEPNPSPPVIGRRQSQTTASSDLPLSAGLEEPIRHRRFDFQFDSTTDGRPINILSVIDEHTRECLGGLVERSITAEKLSDELDRIVGSRRTAPAVLRLDNGPEMIATTLADWAHGRTGMLFIPPGEPWKNLFSSRSTDDSATNASRSTCSGP